MGEEVGTYAQGVNDGWESCLRRVNGQITKDIEVLKRYGSDPKQIEFLEMMQDELIKYDPKEFF